MDLWRQVAVPPPADLAIHGLQKIAGALVAFAGMRVTRRLLRWQPADEQIRYGYNYIGTRHLLKKGR